MNPTIQLNKQIVYVAKCWIISATGLHTTASLCTDTVVNKCGTTNPTNVVGTFGTTCPKSAAVGGVAERISLTPVQEGQLWLKEWGMATLGGLMLLGSGVLWKVRK